MMTDASESDYDSEAYAECNDIDSEHSPDPDYDANRLPMARKKQVHSPLETLTSSSYSSCKQHGMDNMDNMNVSAPIGTVATRKINIHSASGQTYKQEQVEDEEDDGVEEEDEEMRSLHRQDKATQEVVVEVKEVKEVKEQTIPSVPKMKAVQIRPMVKAVKLPKMKAVQIRPRVKAVQTRQKLSIPPMAEHFRDDVVTDVTCRNAQAGRASCGKPLPGKHGMLHPKPHRTVVAPQPIRCQTSMPPQTSTPPGLTEIVRTARSEASVGEAERVRDLQKYALHSDRDNLIPSLRATAARTPSPSRDRLTPAQVREASAAAAARWANGCARMDGGGYAAEAHQIQQATRTEVGMEAASRVGGVAEAKQKPTRWGPRHAPEPCAIPSPKRTRWGPRHPAVLEDSQVGQQHDPSFAVALANLERAQAYQREELYKAFGMWR